MNLYIIRGLPGSGKSTYAKSIGCFHIETDMFYMLDGEYNFDNRYAGIAHQWCQDTLRRAMTTGMDIAVSNTFTTLEEIDPYFELAKKFGYKVMVFHTTGSYGSTHEVPEETLQLMRDRWQRLEKEEIICP